MAKAPKKTDDTSWLDDAPTADTSWLDNAPSADMDDEETASVPQEVNPQDDAPYVLRASEWLERAGEGFPKGSARTNLDYVPILGPALNVAISGGFNDDFKKHRAEREAYESEYPEAATLKNIAGWGGAGAAAAKFAPAAAAGTGVAAAALRTGISGLENAAMTAVDSYFRGDDAGDIWEKSKDAAKYGLLFTGGLEGARQGLRHGAQVVTGIKPETMDKYVARQKEINDIIPENIHDDLAGSINEIKDRGARTRAIVDEKVALRREKLKEKKKKLESESKAAAESQLRDVAERLSDDLYDAKNQVSAASSQAFDLLERSGVRVPLEPIRSEIKRMLLQRTVKVQDPKTGAVRRISDGSPEFNYLKKKLQLFTKFGDDLSPVEMKSQIQLIDREAAPAFAAQRSGDFADDISKEAQVLRRLVDKKLKDTVEGYADVMKPVEEKTRALAAMQKKRLRPDSVDRIFSSLKNIETLGQKDRAAAISAFERTFGVDYRKALSEYQALKNKNFDADLRPDLEAIEQYKKNNYQRIDTFLDPIKGRNPDQALNYLKTYGNRPDVSIPLGRDLEAIATRVNKEPGYYKQMADDYAVQRTFHGEATNGSRNTNLMRYIFGGVGALLGFTKSAGNSEVAAALGAAFGASADKLGRGAVKAMLDFSLSPAGKASRAALLNAARVGPRGIVAFHEIQKRANPEYRRYLEDHKNEDVPEDPMGTDWLDAAPPAD